MPLFSRSLGAVGGKAAGARKLTFTISIAKVNDEWNSSFERVEEFKYLGTTLRIKILFRKVLRAD